MTWKKIILSVKLQMISVDMAIMRSLDSFVSSEHV